MAVDGRGTGHREEIAPPLVEDEVQPEERLQPPAEARLRPPRPLRDRADPPAGRGVEMDDPIGLAVADAAQHDRLGLEVPGHGPPTLPNARTSLWSLRTAMACTTDHNQGQRDCRTASRIAAAVTVAAATPIWIGRELVARPPGREAEDDVAVDRGEDRIDRAAMPAVAARATIEHCRLSSAASVQTQTGVELPSGGTLNSGGSLHRGEVSSAPRSSSPSSPTRADQERAVLVDHVARRVDGGDRGHRLARAR